MRLALSFSFSYTLLTFYQIAWSVFWLAWFGLGKRQQASVIKIPRWQRTFNLLAVIIAFALLLDPQFHVGVLGAYWLPHNRFTAVLGIVIFLVGISFMCWARIHLGTNWSSDVALDDNHRLVRSGPYSIVRHPVYTGILIALTGTTVTTGRIGPLLSLIIATTSYFWKASQEEKIMVDRFGPEYQVYRQKTKMLFPGIY